MLGCHACQDLVLDHLYDLLDEADRTVFLDHLTGCQACQAALEKARAQQSLLARAARLHFPDVRFSPDADQAPEQPVLLPVRPPLPRRRSWVRWAVAACALLTLGGLGVPAYRAHQDYEQAARTVEEHDAVLTGAQEQLASAQRDLARAATRRDQQTEEIAHAVKARELRLVVTGPRTVQAGAPTELQVQAWDLNGQPADAEIVAHLTDGSVPLARLTGEEKETTTARRGDQRTTVSSIGPGLYKVRIPPTVRLQPGQSLGMLVAARKKGVAPGRESVTLHGQVQLTAPVYLTHLTTDKPMYQPGEIVRFRSLTIDRFTLAPAGEEFRLSYTLAIPRLGIRTVANGRTSLFRLDASDKLGEVPGLDGKPIRGIGVGEYYLDPSSSPGGEYVLTVREESGRFPPVTRKFTVNNYQKPRLDKKLDFNRSTYGPGDEVRARVTALRADGGPVRNRPVTVTVNVDDRLIGPEGKETGTSFPLTTDGEGAVLVRFRLPARIERGEASLAVAFDDGFVESIVRTIPVVSKSLQVEFFPEGGDLVAGLPTRVYFQARTPLGKPAQLKGTLLEDGKPLPVTVATLNDDERPEVNQGNGVFAFTPRAGRTYALRIDSPTGITDTKRLQPVREDGIALRVPGGVFDPDQPIRVQVQSTRPRALTIGAYCRGHLLDTVQLDRGQTEAVLRPTSGAGGVCRITVFEEIPTRGTQRQLRPLAERLVYRHPRERLDVSISPDSRRYVPGQKVKLDLATTNEKEKLTPSIALVAVVDQSVLTMADEKTYRKMPTQFLLTSEVRRPEDLEYADFLVGAHPRAARSLDLLLGTQGWRRFAEQDPEQFRKRLEEEAGKLPDADRQRQIEEGERLLVMIGQSAPQTTDFDKEKLDRVQEAFEETAAGIAARHEASRLTLMQANEDDRYRAAVATLGRYQRWLDRTREVLFPVVGVMAALLALAALILALSDRMVRSWTCGGLVAGCCALLIVLWQEPTREETSKRDPTREVAQLTLPHPRIEPLAEAAVAVDDLATKQNEAKVTASTTRLVQTPLVRGTGLGGGGFAMPPGPVPTTAAGAGYAPQGMPSPPMAMMQYRNPGGPPGPKTDKAAADLKKGLFAGDKADGKLAYLGKQAPAVNKPMALGEQRFARDAGRRQLDALRARMAGGKAKGGSGMDRDKDAYALAPLVYREYAHTRLSGQAQSLRTDFAETLVWHPVVVLPSGQTSLSFELSDSVTSFQIAVAAHTLDGRLGAATKQIEAQLPFTLAPKVPHEVTATDRIDLPVTVSNNTNENRLVEVNLTSHLGLDLVSGKSTDRFDVPADGRVRRTYGFRPVWSAAGGSTTEARKATVAFAGKTDPFAADGVRETIRVVPDGFPVAGSSSDLLEGSVTHSIVLPKWIPNTLSCRVDVYPSTLADLQGGLEGLLREPNGCFEQSSTANYPNVLILDYLKSSDQANPVLEKRTRDLLERGYQKLTSFECRKPGNGNAREGYEWFGGAAPPHEALTAYGLLQFRDMARVFEVEPAMLKRTEAYLASQRDGKGGFKRNARAIDTFGRAPDHVTNAYIVWALSEGGKDDVTTELDALLARARSEEDPYFLSLVALGLSNRGRATEATALLRRVAAKQGDDGQVTGARTSITGSGGRDLVIETTALALLGWLKADPLSFDAPIRKSVRWIGQQRGGHGAFGSTQSTILALKALIAHTRANKRTAEAGILRLFVGDEKVAETSFPAGIDRPLMLDLPEAEKKLQVGKNRLRVEITGKKNVFPHTLSWTCRTETPASAAGVPVKLTTKLPRTTLEEGESVRLKVRVENVSGKNQGMVVAIVGLPGGMIVPEDLKQLKEHCKVPSDGKRPVLSAFEIQGRELVLYWRDMGKGQAYEVPIDLIARVPGEYRGPASRAYLYYDADTRHWIEPLGVKITSK